MNKKLHYLNSWGAISLITLAMTMTMSACGEKKQEPQDSTEQGYKIEDKQAGIQAMQESLFEDDITMNGHAYHLNIQRKANKSLPTVKDINGTEFYDNQVEVVITKDGAAFFSKTFTKETFNEYIDSDFRKSGIMEGFVFDKADDKGSYLQFAASIAYPQSDMFIPLVVRITSNGSLSIARDTVLDTTTDAPQNTDDEEGV